MTATGQDARGPGSLSVDGTEVPAPELDRLVTDTARELRAARVPAGSGVDLVTGQPLTVAVTVAAAAALDLPVLFNGRAPLDRAGLPALPAGARVEAGPGGRPHVRAVTAETGAEPLPASAAAVFWTSGSTGEPRAVVVARDTLERQAASTAAWLELDADDTLYTALPLDHAYGHSLLQMWLRRGLRLGADTTFQPRTALDRLRTATSFDGVPGMYRSLLGLARAESGARAVLARLRLRNCGGDLLNASLAEAFAEVVGGPVLDGYGLSEAGPNVAVARPGTTRPGAVGPPLPGVTVDIASAGEIADAAGTGEILVDSPDLMLGYHGDADATAAAFDPRGRLRTGDLGRIDPDNQLVVLGRIKESIIVQGETFAPTSIEAVLSRCPGVYDAGVVGMPTTLSRGDRIAAFLVPEQGAPPSAETVRDHCRRHLPPPLRPGLVEWLPALPRLGTGKLDRRALRSRLPALAPEGTP